MIEQRGGIWWPSGDQHCFGAAQSDSDCIPQMLAFCSSKRTVVQAGGNAGMFPMEFAKHFQRVISFEPDPLNYECLAKNTGDIANIEAYKVGLGEKYKTSGMHIEAINSGAHYMEGEGSIVIVPLDDFEIEDCDLLQLDIEGYELLALQGAIKTINHSKPVIICEEKGLGRFHGIAREAVANFLISLGYKTSDKLGNDVVYIWGG